MLPFKQFRSDLAEDLSALGLSAQDANMLAEARISEETYAPVNESASSEEVSLSYSNDESPFVKTETLERIEALIDTENLVAEEAESLIDALSLKSPDQESKDLYFDIVSRLQDVGNVTEDTEIQEDDIEGALLTIAESLENGEMSVSEQIRVLISLIDSPISEDLEELRDEIIESIYDLDEVRTMLKRVGGAFKKVRVKRQSSAQRAKSRQRYRKNRSKIKRQRIKRGRKASVKKAKGLLQRARKKFGMESTELAQRIRNRAIEESNTFTDNTHIIERIGRVFYELTYHVNEDVVEVMEEQFDILTNSLCESASDLEGAVRPCVAIIAECMKEIESGNC